MRKIGGIALLLSLCLAGCSSVTSSPSSPVADSSREEVSKIAPLVGVPEATQPGIAPEFSDDSLRAKYLAGVKSALNAWRDGVIPSDDALVQGAAEACRLFAEGKTYMEIGALSGDSELARENGGAVAVYASRTFCTQYNTDNL